MSRSKIDFILDILENRTLDQYEKEKFLRLSAKELKNIEQADKELWLEVKQIKNAISKQLDIANTPGSKFSSSTEVSKKNKHRPRDVADFMSLFDHRDKFKYLTHPFDQDRPFRIRDFLEHAEKVFWEKTKELEIPHSLFSLVKNFAFESKLGEKNDHGYLICWRDLKNNSITNGWSKSPIIERLAQNEQNRIHPYNLDEFKNLIDLFRQVTRIKASQREPQLLNYLNLVFDKVFEERESSFKINIDEENIRRADFYCHVRRLVDALLIIAQEFKEAKKSNINITYERKTKGNYRVSRLILCQLDSFPTKDLVDIKKDWFGTKGSMGAVREYLYGYCNWSVETCVSDGDQEKDVRINILKDDDKLDIEELSSNTVGFKHILTFYK